MHRSKLNPQKLRGDCQNFVGIGTRLSFSLRFCLALHAWWHCSIAPLFCCSIAAAQTSSFCRFPASWSSHAGPAYGTPSRFHPTVISHLLSRFLSRQDPPSRALQWISVFPHGSLQEVVFTGLSAHGSPQLSRSSSCPRERLPPHGSPLVDLPPSLMILL